MPIIQRPGAQRKLQLQYGLEGHPPAPTLSPEIVPVTIVDDLSGSASAGQPGAPGAGIPIIDVSDPLSAKQYEKTSSNPDPGPGNWAQTAFVNPRGSGVIAMITSITGTANVDSSIVPFFASSTILGSIPADRGFLRDLRLIQVGSDSTLTNLSQCALTQTTRASSPSQIRPGIKLGPAQTVNTPRDVRFLGYVVRPNSHIIWTFTAADQPWTLHLIWTERQALDTELGLPAVI